MRKAMNATPLVIENGILLTMEKDAPIIADGAVLIEENKILACGDAKTVEIPEKASRSDAKGGMIMPGLVNCHTHLPMVMFRGMADDLPLDVWLNDHIFPAEASLLNPESVAQWARHSCEELLLSGTTCCADGYFFEGEVAKAMKETGIRGVAGQGIVDFPAPGAPDPSRNIQVAKAHVESVKDLSPIVYPSICCHASYTCSAKTLVAAKQAAKDSGVLFQIHAAETRDEIAKINGTTQTSVIRYLDHLGILDDRTLLSHCVWLDETDITIIRQSGAAVVHCPESNLKLASGVAPIPALIDAGVPVGLGTDGAASNNDQDLLGEMDTAAKLHKGVGLDPCVMDAKTCLKMATLWGAKCLGLGDVIGSITPGKLADILILDTRAHHMRPLNDPYSAIVYAAKGADVSWVLVDGRVRVKEGKLV